MSERERVALTDAETNALLGASTKVQLATINRDGTPHLVTMFYTMHRDRIAFWTYRASRKAHNLARDPRLTCLVEDGESYFELRGVQVNGVATPIEDPDGVATVGRLIAARLALVPVAQASTVSAPSAASTVSSAAQDTVDAYVARAARKRIAYLVEPVRISGWDHRKLLT